MAARRVAFRAFWGRQRRLTMARIAGATLPAQKTRKDDHTYHPFMIEGTRVPPFKALWWRPNGSGEEGPDAGTPGARKGRGRPGNS